MSEEQNDLKKQAQELLVQAERCLEQAAEIAEKGGFNISFHEGGTYVSSAAFNPTPAVREKAIERARRAIRGWDVIDPEVQESYLEDYVNDVMSDMRPYEASEPGWWQPSRNC